MMKLGPASIDNSQIVYFVWNEFYKLQGKIMRSLKTSLQVFILPVTLFAQWRRQNFYKMNIGNKWFLGIKRTLLILFCFILFGGEVNSQSGNAKSLEVGNKWVYLVTELSTYYVYWEVIGDTIFNDTNYAAIYLTQSNGGNAQYVYERADSIKLFRYITQYGYEKALVDFSLNVGDSISYYVVTSKSY